MRVSRNNVLLALVGLVIAMASSFLGGLQMGRNHTPRVPAYVTCAAEYAPGVVRCPPPHNQPVLATWLGVNPEDPILGKVDIVARYGNLEWILFTDPERPLGAFSAVRRPPDYWVELGEAP